MPTVSSQALKAGARNKIKKAIVNLTTCRARIRASFNNTIITMTDLQGNSLPQIGGQFSAGKAGLKGSRKGTPHAAQLAATRIAEKVMSLYKIQNMIIYLKGIGAGGPAAAKELGNHFKVKKIMDLTGPPHNGPREKKKRRT